MKYSDSGTEYRPTELPEGSCLVWTQMDGGEEGEAYDGELRIVNKTALHDTPPRGKIDEQIALASAILEELHDHIRARRKELAAFDDGQDERMARLKQHKSLARLDDYIAGRITHYVEYDYGTPEIIAFEDATTDDASHGQKKRKLLTLFGSTKGDLEWGLNRWSDGSGNSMTVIPCCSHNEAIEVVRKRYEEQDKDAMDPETRTRPYRSWVDAAEKHGIQMSDGYMRALEEQEAEKKQASIINLESKLAKLRE